MQTNTPSNFTLADGAGHTFFEHALHVLRMALAAEGISRRDTSEHLGTM
jgi:hypothetical protein